MGDRGSTVTARHLATLILEALEAGDYAYVETLALSALEDTDEDAPAVDSDQEDDG
jgi:hypothetical protein